MCPVCDGLEQGTYSVAHRKTCPVELSHELQACDETIEKAMLTIQRMKAQKQKLQAKLAASDMSKGYTSFDILDAPKPHRFLLCSTPRTAAATQSGWTIRDSFLTFAMSASPYRLPGMVVFNVLEAHEPHRMKVSRDGPGEGWTLRESFCAFRDMPSHLPAGSGRQWAQFHILQAGEPHRFMVSRAGTGEGWVHVESFWASVPSK